MPLGVAKLSDRALPTGGVSGTVFLVSITEPTWAYQAALHKRPFSWVSLVAYYMAYLLAALASVSAVVVYRDLYVWIVAVTAVFSVIAGWQFPGALWLRRRGKQTLPGIRCVSRFKLVC